MASNYSHRRSAAIKVSIVLILFSLIIIVISSQRNQVVISGNFWQKATNIAEQALVLHAHQLSDLGWSSFTSFKNRNWNIPFNHEGQQLNIVVNIKCSEDLNNVFMVLHCEAEVPLLDEIYTFKQTLNFKEFSSKQSLKFQPGTISLVKHTDKKGQEFKYSNNNKIDLPSILVELAKAENNTKAWGEIVSKLIQSKNKNAFNSYLYYLVVLKTIELCNELSLQQSIEMLRTSKLISNLEYMEMDYLKLSSNALGIELQTFHTSQEVSKFKTQINRILINFAQNEFSKLDESLLKNPLYAELINILSRLSSENYSNLNFKKLSEITSTSSLKLLSLSKPQSFIKQRLANNIEANSVFLWRNKITYLDIEGNLWSLNPTNFIWQSIGKIDVNSNDELKMVKTVDDLLGFETLVAYNGSSLLVSDDGVNWDSFDLPNHLKDLNNFQFIAAKEAGVIIVNNRKVWLSTDFSDWQRKNDLVFDSKYSSIVIHDDQYIQYGGCSDDQLKSCGKEAAKSENLDRWNKFRTSFSKKRKQAAIYSTGDSIYVHGGSHKIYDSNLYYSADGRNFKAIYSVNTSDLRQHFLIKLNNKLFILGGINKKNHSNPFIYTEHSKLMQSLSSCGLQLFLTFQTFQT